MSPALRSSTATGVLATVAAYLIWGVLPLYFLLLPPAGAVEIVAWRVLIGFAFCAVVITAARGWRRLSGVLRDRRAIGWLVFASAAIGVNWVVYVGATLAGNVVEGALGYFINPVFTVLMGVLLLRERLRPLQWLAVGISAVAVAVLVVAHGVVPWLALILAMSFALYGFAKNRLGPRVDAVGGLAAETAILAPAALVALVVVGSTSGLAMGAAGPLHAVLLVLVGVATAVPLILFAAGAQRIPLSYLGLLQFLSPVLQFLLGVVLLHEPMPPERWAGFAIVWVALLVLALDIVLHGARRRRSRIPDPAEGIAEVV